MLHTSKLYQSTFLGHETDWLQTKRGIHGHQTLPRYCDGASGSRLKVQPSTHRHIWPITAKCDVIHKTVMIATPPEEDQATATGDLYNKFREDQSSGSLDILSDRQTDAQTDKTN